MLGCRNLLEFHHNQLIFHIICVGTWTNPKQSRISVMPRSVSKGIPSMAGDNDLPHANAELIEDLYLSTTYSNLINAWRKMFAIATFRSCPVGALKNKVPPMDKISQLEDSFCEPCFTP